MISMEQLLRMLAPRYTSRQNIVSYHLKQKIVSEEKFQMYTPELQMIYRHFFNDQKNKLEIEKIMPFQIRKTKMPVCNKLLTQTLTVYKCYDCFIHEAAVLCVQCFERGDHAGHRFKKFQSGGGNCDCGNPLAIKKQGFCIDHSGQVEIPQISPQERKIFNYIIGSMLQWLFKLVNMQEPFAQSYGLTLVSYLTKINTNSIYYNVLSFRLITKKAQQGFSFLSEMLKIKSSRLQMALNEFFFSMFSLDEFKVILADQYLTSYNTISGIQKSAFHSLYIQLFANDNIVIELTQKLENTIHVTKSNYDVSKYLSDLSFISTIAVQPAFVFYELYFRKNCTVPYPFLQEIQDQLEKSDKMHYVDLVTKSIDNQNSFYLLFNALYEKIKKNKPLLISVIKGLYRVLCSQAFSYKKNKAVLPYHRVFALGIFTLMNGNTQQIQARKIASVLEIEDQQIGQIFVNNADKVISCLLDFAQTFVRSSYFDNYVVLYARSGFVSILLDQLHLKQAAYIFQSLNSFEQSLSKILIYKLNQQLRGWETQTRCTLAQLMSKWINLSNLLLQICMTNSYEVILNQRLGLNNEKLLKDRRQLFSKILTKTGPVTTEEITVLEKHFIHIINDQFLGQNAVFNKATKKYSPKEEVEGPQFLYDLYFSKRKAGQLLLKEQQENVLNQELQKMKVGQHEKIMLSLLPAEFILKLTEQVIGNTKKMEQIQAKKLLTSMCTLLKKISIGVTKNQYSLSIQKLKQNLTLQEHMELNKMKSQQNSQIDEMQIKRKQSSKKAKFLQKQKRIVAKFHIMQEAEQAQNQILCILCKQNNKQHESLLCLGSVKLKKMISLSEDGNKNFGFIFDSCFHVTHQRCFRQFFKKKMTKKVCPLCKAYCNILLPGNIEYGSEQFKSALLCMGETIKSIKSAQSNNIKFLQASNTPQFCVKMQIFVTLLDCMIQQIGFIGVVDPPLFRKKVSKVCKQICNTLIVQWNLLHGIEKQNLYQVIGKKIQKYRFDQTDKPQSQNQIISAIKHCIMVTVFNHIQGKQVKIDGIEQMYENAVNTEDLICIKRNLQMVIYKSEAIEPQSRIKQISKIPSVKTFYKFYSPPSTVKQLIIQRDQLTSKNCKNGHNVCICCECEKIVCSDCNTLSQHQAIHGSESMYFSLLTGSLVIYTFRKLSLPSLYENKLGATWSEDKMPQGFELNRDLYNDLVMNLSLHSIQEYLRNRLPKLKEQTDLSDIIIFNNDDD